MNSALQGEELPLTYTGSLFRVIDLCCEQWPGDPRTAQYLYLYNYSIGFTSLLTYHFDYHSSMLVC